MLSLQEISDRLEIQQLMIDYSSAIDQREFDRLDEVFTPDAYIDYRAMGGIDGRYPEVKAWLKPALASVSALLPHDRQHGDQSDRRHRVKPHDLLQPDGGGSGKRHSAR